MGTVLSPVVLLKREGKKEEETDLRRIGGKR